MKVLLDTHTFLWWNMDDPQLSPAARALIADGRNEIFLSAASAWEISIKHARGRLELPEPPVTYVPSRMRHYHFRALPVEVHHTLHVNTLPDLHRDPFDRLLIAQAQLEDLSLVSGDEEVHRYDVKVIW
jgi:PIN domain nuclease of toxin-antitoxin system